jgi:hypothetical protein
MKQELDHWLWNFPNLSRNEMTGVIFVALAGWALAATFFWLWWAGIGPA